MTVTAGKTVREIVREIQARVLKDTYTPLIGADDLLTLTSLLSNCDLAVRDADAKYAVVLRTVAESEPKVNRARLIAETDPAYGAMREAHDVYKEADKLIGSLKYYLRTSWEEMRLTRG